MFFCAVSSTKTKREPKSVNFMLYHSVVLVSTVHDRVISSVGSIDWDVDVRAEAITLLNPIISKNFIATLAPPLISMITTVSTTFWTKSVRLLVG